MMIKKAIAQLSRLFVTPCLIEDESYATRSRKIFSITIAVGAFIGALLLGIPVIILSALQDPSFGAYLVGALLLIVSMVSSLFPYGYLRYTKTLPDWLVEVQIWTALFLTFTLLLFVHQGSVTIIGSCVVLLGVILRVRAWPLIVICGVAFNVLHALINDFSDHLPALHETFYSTQLLSIRILYLFGSNISPLLCVAAGLQMIMMEFVERSEQADAAIAMNLAVADKLLRYDTDGIATILAANKGIVDEKLLAAFAAIQHNLQEYRPHIPDYVIASTLATYNGNTEDSEGDEEDDDKVDTDGDSCDSILYMPESESEDTCILLNQVLNADDEEEANNHALNNPTPHRRPTAASESGSHAVSTEEGSINSSSVPSNTSNTSTPCGKFKGKKPIADAKDLSRTHNHHHCTTGPHHQPPNPESPHEGRARQHFYGRATTVFVRFVSAPCGSDGSGNGFVSKGSAVSAMNILSKCVDAGSKLAKAHGGALQYMQGCGLMVSFNAASRVAAHESKACGFAIVSKSEPDIIFEKCVTDRIAECRQNGTPFYSSMIPTAIR